jgi:hypothetical protein
MVYKLDGFSRPNLTKLRENFKSHLITVSSEAVASSDRAQSEKCKNVSQNGHGSSSRYLTG